MTVPVLQFNCLRYVGLKLSDEDDDEDGDLVEDLSVVQEGSTEMGTSSSADGHLTAAHSLPVVVPTDLTGSDDIPLPTTGTGTETTRTHDVAV